jgi:N-acetylmuramoyl-L-alanine amidase
LQIKNIIDTLAKHKAKTYKTRSTDKIKYIIVHHSATVQGSAESFANYHVKNNGWPGIGYHFVITKKGEIYQTNHIKTIRIINIRFKPQILILNSENNY